MLAKKPLTKLIFLQLWQLVKGLQQFVDIIKKTEFGNSSKPSNILICLIPVPLSPDHGSPKKQQPYNYDSYEK